MQRHRPVTVALSVAPRPLANEIGGPKDGPIRPADLPPFLANMQAVRDLLALSTASATR